MMAIETEDVPQIGSLSLRSSINVERDPDLPALLNSSSRDVKIDVDLLASQEFK
jgi:hypothetical protein